MEDDKKSAKKSTRKSDAKKATPAKPTTDKPAAASVAATPSAGVMPDLPAPKEAPRGKRRWLPIVLTLVGLVAAFLIVFGVLIYKYKSDSRIVEVVASVVPYPAQKVNGSFVSYHDYLFEVKSIKHYYLSQTTADNKPAIDFNTKEGKTKLTSLQKQVMEQQKGEVIVRDLAAKYKLKVTDKEVQTQLEQITKSAGGKDKVREVLKKFYGWEETDLKEKIRFQLLRQKVADKVGSDASANASAKSKAENVLKEVKAGGDFAALAKKHSQDSSSANGGDLGLFSKGQMVKEFEDVAFSLQPGQTSDIVKTKFGFHIIKVTDKKGEQVQASHILIKTVDFDQYLKEQTSKAKVTQYLKI